MAMPDEAPTSKPVTAPDGMSQHDRDSPGQRVTVIIVNYRTADLTVAAVTSALGAGTGEVIVVDNGSEDDTAARLAAFGDPAIQVIERGNNGGYGVAANAGAVRATGDVLVFLNSDATLSADAMAALAEEVHARGGRCIAGARLVDEEGTIQPSAGLMPGPTDLAIRVLGLHHLARLAARLPLISHAIRRTRLAAEYGSAAAASESFGTSMVSGACFAIGRAAFEKVGGFDERFFLYFEDADLCRRAARAGMAVRYVPAAIVPHIGGASSSEDYHFGPPHARAMRQYLQKWYGPAGGGYGPSVAVVSSRGAFHRAAAPGPPGLEGAALRMVNTAVVIPVRNGAGQLLDCVASVLRQTSPPDEILIVVGPSTDDSRRVAQDLVGQTIRVLDNPAGDRGSGLNAALSATDARTIAMVDAQSRLEPDYLDRALATLGSAEADVAGGPMRAVGQSPVGRAMALALASPFGIGDSQFHFGVGGAGGGLRLPGRVPPAGLRAHRPLQHRTPENRGRRPECPGARGRIPDLARSVHSLDLPVQERSANDLAAVPGLWLLEGRAWYGPSGSTPSATCGSGRVRSRPRGRCGGQSGCCGGPRSLS